MKSMKNLMVAVAGLAGFALAGSAFAQSCTNTNLSAWSGTITNKGTVSVVAGGLEATPSACKMQAALTNSDPLATAAVYFSDSTNESSYHFRFYFNQANVAGLTGLASSQIFAATGPNSPNGVGFVLELGLIPGSGGVNQLVAAVACNSAADQYICLTNPISVSSAANHYIEGYITQGASATVKLWLDHDASAAVQPAPDASLTVDNNAWGGVNLVALGLGGASPGFKLNQNVSFDAFDSRRQTFIGP